MKARDEGAELGADTPAPQPHQQRAADLERFARDGFVCFYLDAGDDVTRWHEGVGAVGADPSLAVLRAYADGVAVVFYLPAVGGAA